MNNTHIQELSFKEKINKPVVKYGCFPALVLFILFIISIFTNNKTADMDTLKSNSEIITLNSDIIVNDFCTLSLNDLEAKYGNATKEVQAGDDVYNWTLTDHQNIRVMLFNTGKNREIARFFNIKLGSVFWNTLGWDRGDLEINTLGKFQIVRNLNGINEAMYKYELKMLDVKLTDNITNFGKQQ